MRDPDDPRLWWVIVPVLLASVVIAVLFALSGEWLLLALVALMTAFSGWGTWQAGKPMWPGGPRRRS